MVLRRVALTGASGMLGRHLLAVLQSKNVQVHATSRTRPPLCEGLSWSPWDLEDWRSPEELDCLFGQVDALIHLGAWIPKENNANSCRAIFDVNVRASLCLGEWAQKRDIPLVFISSSMVYDQPERMGILEEDPKVARGSGNLYGLSKRIAEETLQYFSGDGLKLCILRPSSLYGYGLESAKTVSRFLQSAGEGRVIELFPPAEDAVDFVHAFDVALATVDALEKEVTGEFNISSGSMTTMEQLARSCLAVTSRGEIRIAESPSRPPLKRFGLDSGKAERTFGYRPRYSLETGLGIMWRQIQLGRCEFFHDE